MISSTELARECGTSQGTVDRNGSNDYQDRKCNDDNGDNHFDQAKGNLPTVISPPYESARRAGGILA
jgi:hypothetical protein